MKYSIYIPKPLLHAAEQLGVNRGKVTGCKIHAPTQKSRRIWRHAHELDPRPTSTLSPGVSSVCMQNVGDVYKGVCNNQTEGQGTVG